MQIDCPKKISCRLNAIPNSKIELPKTKLFIIANTYDAYMTYLQNVDVEPSPYLEENRRLVEKHLLKRGYILTNPEVKKVFPLPYTITSYMNYLRSQTKVEIDQSIVEKQLIDGGFVLKPRRIIKK